MIKATRPIALCATKRPMIALNTRHATHPPAPCAKRSCKTPTRPSRHRPPPRARSKVTRLLWEQLRNPDQGLGVQDKTIEPIGIRLRRRLKGGGDRLRHPCQSIGIVGAIAAHCPMRLGKPAGPFQYGHLSRVTGNLAHRLPTNIGFEPIVANTACCTNGGFQRFVETNLLPETTAAVTQN